MSDIKNTLDLLTKLEESTVAGGVAPVSAPLGAQKQVKESGPEAAPKAGRLKWGDWANDDLTPSTKPKSHVRTKQIKTKKGE
jgi:hypothetical protein